MPADTLLIIVLTALGATTAPLALWLRALRRIRHLEMTLLVQTTDSDRYEELRALLNQIEVHTDQLADSQALLARRLGDRIDQLPLAGVDHPRSITPH